MVSQLFGVFSGLSAIAAILTLRKFTRKGLMMYGYLMMSVELLIFSYSIKYGYEIVGIIFVLIFTITFFLTMGAVHWIYIPEILSDI
jgi:hypothetical protein